MRIRVNIGRQAAAVAVAMPLLAAACGGSGRSEQQTTRGTPANQSNVTVLAAGDIAGCDTDSDDATAELVARMQGTVLALGDEAYDSGTAKEFSDCYEPTWGRVKDRTRPTPGNHEYDTDGAAGYFDYFGSAAGPMGKGYYSFDLGAWHVVSLNSNCSAIGGCDAGSPQERWLRSDLKAHPARCTLAYWHHPRFSSGTEHGSAEDMQPIWQTLQEGGGDVVLSGHEHNYERFAPQTATGKHDSKGIREFVVGTGGKSHYQDFARPLPNSEVRNDNTFGVLELQLSSTGYDWEFVRAGDGQFTDAGSASCHG